MGCPLLTATVPRTLKMNLFFDDGCKSFILIWSVIGTEGGDMLRPLSEANAEARVDCVNDGVKDWTDDGIPSVVGVINGESSKEYSIVGC